MVCGYDTDLFYKFEEHFLEVITLSEKYRIKHLREGIRLYSVTRNMTNGYSLSLIGNVKISELYLGCQMISGL